MTRNFKYLLRNIVGNIHVILLCGGVCTLVLGFVWLVLLQHFTSYIVYGTLQVVMLAEVMLTVLLYAKAGAFGTHDPFAASGGNQQQGSTLNLNGIKVLVNTRVNSAQSFHDPVLEAEFHWLAIGMSAVCGFTAMWIMWMRPYLRVAIGVIQEAARMLRQMPLLFFPLPLVPVGVMFLLMY